MTDCSPEPTITFLIVAVEALTAMAFCLLGFVIGRRL